MKIARQRLVLAAVIATVITAAACGGDNNSGSASADANAIRQQDQQRQLTPNATQDQSVAPGDDVQPDLGRGARGAAPLYANQVRTRHVFNGAITAGKIGYKAVAISVTNGTPSGASASDPDLVAGVVTGCYPTGNQDQFIDNVALNAGTGALTVTLAANATVTNTFSCTVLKANAKGVP